MVPATSELWNTFELLRTQIKLLNTICDCKSVRNLNALPKWLTVTRSTAELDLQQPVQNLISGKRMFQKNLNSNVFLKLPSKV